MARDVLAAEVDGRNAAVVLQVALAAVVAGQVVVEQVVLKPAEQRLEATALAGLPSARRLGNHSGRAAAQDFLLDVSHSHHHDASSRRPRVASGTELAQCSWPWEEGGN